MRRQIVQAQAMSAAPASFQRGWAACTGGQRASSPPSLYPSWPWVSSRFPQAVRCTSSAPLVILTTPTPPHR